MKARFKTSYLFFISLVLMLGCRKNDSGTKTRLKPRIISVDTTIVQVGDKLTLAGENFNPRTVVSLNDLRISVVSVASNKLVVQVASGARTGKLSLIADDGTSITFEKSIRVIQKGEPFILSVQPSGEVFDGDTLLIRGVNFDPRAESTGVTVGGTGATLLNTTDTTVTALVPNVRSGSLVVTRNDLSSLPFPLNIGIEDRNPLEDGRIYYVYSNAPGKVSPGLLDLNTTTTIKKLLRGPDDEGNLGGTIVRDLPPLTAQFSAKDYPFLGVNWIRDADESFNCQGYSTPTSAPPSFSYVTNLKIDGTTASFSYSPYTLFPTVLNTNDITQVFPNITQFTNQLNQGIQAVKVNSQAVTLAKQGYLLTKNFFVTLGAITANAFFRVTDLTDNMVRFGDKSLFSGLTVRSILGGPAHGDSVLVYATYKDQGFNKSKILLLNASTLAVKVLYDQSNWGPDAVGAIAPSNTTIYIDYNIAFLWEGPHLYYANQRRNVTSTQLLRLNADGSSKRPTLIYNRMESENLPRANQIALMIKPSEAR